MATLWENKTQLVWAKGKGYEWTQTVEEVQIKINVPKGTKGKDVVFKLTINHLTVGLKGQAPVIDVSCFAIIFNFFAQYNFFYLQGQLSHGVIPDDSLWTLEDNEELYIQLQKIKRHESWASVCVGNEIDPFTKQEMDKKMMLEKFQREVNFIFC